MRKFIRNDYTLTVRLKRLAQMKLEEERNMSIFDKKLRPVFRLHMKINDLIEEIENDMKLKMMERINTNESFKEEYDCLVV